MRHRLDPNRRRPRVQLRRVKTVSAVDENGDPTTTETYEILYRGTVRVQAWLPRYNIPTAPISGGVAERRVASRAYFDSEALEHLKEQGVMVYMVDTDKYHAIIADGLDMADGDSYIRVDLGAPRVSQGTL